MLHFLDLLLERHDLLIVFVLHDQHRDGARSKLIHQNVLSLDGLNAVRQIGQNIVIDPRMRIPPDRRDQQGQGKDQDQMPDFNHCAAKTLHNLTPTPVICSCSARLTAGRCGENLSPHRKRV